MPPLPSALLKTVMLMIFFSERAPVQDKKKGEEAGINLLIYSRNALNVDWIKFTQPSLDLGKINTLTVLECALMTTKVHTVQ